MKSPSLRAAHSLVLSALMFAAGCQRPVDSQGCVQAVTRGKNTGASGRSSLIGGFLEIDAVVGADAAPYRLPQEKPLAEKKRCSAFFEVKSIEEKKIHVDVWSATHCILPPFVEKFSAQVYLDGGYVHVPLTMPAFDGLRKVRSEASGLPEEVQAEIMRSFSPVPAKYGYGDGEDARKETIALGKPLCQTTSAGKNDVAPTFKKTCFMLEDTGVYQATLEIGSLPQDDRGVLVESANVSKKAQGKAGSPVFSAWKKAVQQAIQIDREVVVASLADQIVVCSGDSLLCQNKTVVGDILKRYALPGDRNIMQEAMAAKEKKNQPLALTQEKQNQSLAARTELHKAWKDLKEHLLRSSNIDIGVLTNLESSKNGLELSLLPIEKVGGDKNGSQRFYVRDYGFVFLAGNKEVDTIFRPGDSGSMILADGRFPLTVVTSSNEQDTSGGASVINLPVRKKREASNSKQETEEQSPNEPQRRSSRQEASAPGSSPSGKTSSGIEENSYGGRAPSRNEQASTAQSGQSSTSNGQSESMGGDAPVQSSLCEGG